MDNYYTFKELEKYDEIIHLYSKRNINFYNNIEGEDRLKAYNQLEKDTGHIFKKIVMGIQTHTNNVKVVREDNIDDKFDDVDGLVTNLVDVALITYSADCQTIMLYDPVKKVIGNIHSGWVGTLNKIVVNGIKIMIEEYGCNPKDIIACINPSILKCCFEVDKDVVDKFVNNFENMMDFVSLGEIKEGKQKYFIDTIGLNRRVMIEQGLLDSNIFTADQCTKCNCDKYYSYRGEHSNKRNVALIAMIK